MKVVMIVIAAMFLSTANAGDKATRQSLETNGWDECVRRYDEGAIMKGNFFITGNYVIGGSMLFSVTNYAVGWGCYRPECTKDHLADYPKSSTYVAGVQWVKEYDSMTVIDGKTNVVTWIRHEYPHQRIVTQTTLAVKIVTTVTTNVTDNMQDPKCKNCGKR